MIIVRALFIVLISDEVDCGSLCLLENWFISCTLLSVWGLNDSLVSLLKSVGSVVIAPGSFLILMVCVLPDFFPLSVFEEILNQFY